MPSEIIYLVEVTDMRTLIQLDVKCFHSKEKADNYANTCRREDGTILTVRPIVTED